jgi:hypothetical protein
MDLFGVYADSDEDDGQSFSAGDAVQVESGEKRLHPAFSCGDSQASGPRGPNIDMDSVGGPPGLAEEQGLPPSEPLESLPQDLRDPPPGEAIAGIAVSHVQLCTISLFPLSCNDSGQCDLFQSKYHCVSC